MNSPRDPMTPARTAAVAAHELFTALMEAGFKEQQALYLTAQIVTNSRDDE